MHQRSAAAVVRNCSVRMIVSLRISDRVLSPGERKRIISSMEFLFGSKT